VQNCERCALANQERAAARAAFGAALPEWEEVVRTEPSWGGGHCVLGLIYAGLERKEEALREGRRALELTPVAKNAADGPGVLYFFAVICAWTGERDLAIEQLETLAKIRAAQITASSASIRCSIRSRTIRASKKSSPRSRRKIRSSSPDCADCSEAGLAATIQCLRPDKLREALFPMLSCNTAPTVFGTTRGFGFSRL